MNARQWNAAMFSALAALVVIAVPFLATAQDFGFDFDDIGYGDFDDLGNADIDDISDADFDDFGNSDFDDFGSADFDDAGGYAGPADIVPADTVLPVDVIVPGWDAFDGDLGPFDDIPGNPSGDDIVIPQPHPDEIPVVPPAVPPVVPPAPKPSPSPSEEGSLKIFIHNIFMNSPFDELPGNQVALRITFENTGSKRLENTKIIVGIPDLSARASFGPLDLSAGEKVTSTVFLDLPEDTMPGVYPVRLQVYNEKAQRIVHREIEVVDYS